MRLEPTIVPASLCAVPFLWSLCDVTSLTVSGWPAAQREGLNLDEENYDAEIDYLENVDFDQLVASLRADGVSIDGTPSAI